MVENTRSSPYFSIQSKIDLAEYDLTGDKFLEFIEPLESFK